VKQEEKTMTRYGLMLILPLAACVPHADPYLRQEPCDPRIEVCQCVGGGEGGQRAAEAPQGPSEGGGGVTTPGDNGGDSNGGSSDSNGDNSHE
jgi:hypothetical protein